MNNELRQILNRLRELYPLLKDTYQINSIEIFGSYVRNEQNLKSDLDLLVTFSNIPGLLKFIELKNFLSDQLNLTVDLVMKDTLRPGIAENIINEAISI